MSRLRESKPIAHLLRLYKDHDASVLWLGGSFWAGITKELGVESFVGPLIEGLADESAAWRAFSCRAVESLQLKSAIPVLVGLLEDEEVVVEILGDPPERTVRRAIGEPSVGVYAASALASMGRADGVRLLLDHASRVQDWEDSLECAIPRVGLTYVEHFKFLSGEDFGDDLERWRKWFQPR